MGLFDSFFTKTVAAQDVLFPVNPHGGDVKDSVRLFGKLCREIAKAIPGDKRESLTYKVSVDRNGCMVKFSIDVGYPRMVNLRKIMPGFRYAEMLGWESNENYIEGELSYIDLPDAWDGDQLNTGIIAEFRKMCSDAVVKKSFDDVVNSRLAGVVFQINI